MSSPIGAQQGPVMSWSQARSEIRNNANTDTVAQALLPQIQQDTDGMIEIQFGTTLLDYANVVKQETQDTRSSMDIAKDIQTKNPFITDINSIQAGDTLDLSSYNIHDNTGSSTDSNSGCNNNT